MSKNNEEKLSNRERQVYSHIIKGESQKHIAEQLYICLRTVKFHCGNIYKKLQVKNKTELIRQLHMQERVLRIQEQPTYLPKIKLPPQPKSRPEVR